MKKMMKKAGASAGAGDAETIDRVLKQPLSD